MAGELTYPILPCADIDEAIAFYEALGFQRTYRQTRPNPYAVARLADARGDDGAGLRLLATGIAKHPDAPAPERIRALAYLAELNLRLGEAAEAERLVAEATEIVLSGQGTDDTLDHVRQLLTGSRHQLEQPPKLAAPDRGATTEGV